MRLDIVPFVRIPDSSGVEECHILRADGCVVDILRNVSGTGMYDIYLDDTTRFIWLERWLDLEPLTAQAILHHLLPTE